MAKGLRKTALTKKPSGLRLASIATIEARIAGANVEVFLHDSGQVAHCPGCGGDNMEKLISAFSTMKTEARASGTTCCGRSERCDTPPCSTGDVCRRDQRR